MAEHDAHTFKGGPDPDATVWVVDEGLSDSPAELHEMTEAEAHRLPAVTIYRDAEAARARLEELNDG